MVELEAVGLNWQQPERTKAKKLGEREMVVEQGWNLATREVSEMCEILSRTKHNDSQLCK